MRWSVLILGVSVASAFVPAARRVSPRALVTAKIQSGLSLQSRQSGLSLQSRGGGVMPAALRRQQAATNTALRAKSDDGDAKIDLSQVDWDAANKADSWAMWKNTIYGGSLVIGLLLPVFFLVVKP